MRKFLIVVGILLVAYTVVGFFFLPMSARYFGERALQDRFGEEARIDKVRANPFTWRVTVEGGRIPERSGQWEIRWASAMVDLSPSSIFRLYPVLNAIELKNPYVYFLRLPEAEPSPELDWREVLAELSAQDIPEVRIDSLVVRGGRIDFRDETNPTVYTQTIDPINFQLRNFTTVVEGENAVRLLAETEDGALVEWEGRFISQSLASEGFFRIEGLQVDALSPYFAEKIRFDLQSAVLGFEFEYRLDLGDLEQLFAMHNGRIVMTDLLCRALEGQERIIAMETLAVDGVSVLFPLMEVSVDTVRMDRGLTRIQRGPDGQLNLLELLVLPEAVEADSSVETGANVDTAEVSYRIRRVEITDYRVLWEDTLESGVAHLEVGISRAEFSDITSDMASPIPLRAAYTFGETGQAAVEGTVTLDGLLVDLEVKVVDLPLELGAAYAREFAQVDLAGGQFSFEGSLLSAEPFSCALSGSGRVANFGAAMEGPYPIQAGWEALRFDGLRVKLDPLSVELDRLVIEDGRFRMIDATVDPVFEVMVEELAVTIEDLHLDGDQSARVTSTALINRSPLKVDGQMFPMDLEQMTEIQLSLEGLSLPALSPYSGKAVGRAIADGLLTLDSEWRIDNGQLTATNAIRIDQLELGRSVPGGGLVPVPLDLLVGLLKGADGVIRLSLPFSGDLTDPQAEVGQIVSTAIIGVITGIVSSPFSLLSGLVGTETEDLSKVEFEAGRDRLTAAMIRKLDALAEALQQRPAVRLQMAAGLSEEDRLTLARRQLREGMLGEEAATDDAAYFRALQRLHRDRARATGVQPPSWPEDRQEAIAAMEAPLLAGVEPDEQAVQRLAQARIEAVRDHLVTSQGIDPDRIAPGSIDPERGESVVRFDLQ